MLRIDPAFPPLWRSATSLQFGVDAVAVIPDPTPWQLRLVHQLEHGIDARSAVPFAVAEGASRRAAEAFLVLVEPALERDVARAPAVVHAAGEVPRSHVEILGRALEAAGCDVDAARGFDPRVVPQEGAVPVVVVAHRVVPPAFGAALMASDRAHLPVVLSPSAADIGPFIAPGLSPCLACLAAERRDADPTWPALAAQLLGRSATDVEESVLWEAGIVAGRMLTASARHPGAMRDQSMTVRAGSLHRALRTHRPHEECGCRSPEGTSRADVASLPVPMTPTAFAQPA